MQELSILDYSLVHRSAPIKATGALMAAVSFQTKTLRPYMEEIEVGGCIVDSPQALINRPCNLPHTMELGALSAGGTLIALHTLVKIWVQRNCSDW